MENKHLIDLSVKYGLNAEEISKLVSIVYQAGINDMNSREFQRVSTYICEAGIINMPAEELMEELKLKGLIPK